MTATKIATCCYCGTRAVLALKGEVRHELACTKCGAPLSKIKMLPTKRAAAPVAVQPTVNHRPRSQGTPPKKVYRRKSLRV